MPVPEQEPSPSSQQASAPSRLDSRAQRPLRIALFGFGTVGISVARILVESRPEGLELTRIYVRSVARRHVDWVPASVQWSEDADAVLASDVDVIVELAGGIDPAGGWVRKALKSGKSVVTANKKLISLQGRTGAAGRLRRRTVEVWRRSGWRNPRDSRVGTRACRRSDRTHRRHFERHLQLHIEQNAGGRRIRPCAGGGSIQGLRRGRSYGGRGRL